MQCESAAHQRSGKPGSTLPVGYGSTSKLVTHGQGLGAALDRLAGPASRRFPRARRSPARRRRRSEADRSPRAAPATRVHRPCSASRAAARPPPPGGTSRSTSGGRRSTEPSGGANVDPRRAGRASPRGGGSTGRRRRRPVRPGSSPALRLDRGRRRPSRPVEKPVTSTPSTIDAPAARALSASPSIDSRLKAKPPTRSCRQTVSPSARQSPNRPRMWARHLVLAGVQLRRIADPLLALEDLEPAHPPGRADRARRSLEPW